MGGSSRGEACLGSLRRGFGEGSSMGDPQELRGEIETFFRNSKLPLPEGLLSLKAFCLASDPLSLFPKCCTSSFFLSHEIG